MAGTTVKIKNVGDDTFARKYEFDLYEVDPGKVAFVPEEAAWHWFGNPHYVDAGPQHHPRQDAYDRLRVYYGAYDDDDIWERNKPNVEVYDLNDERLTTIIDDPEGKSVSPARQTVTDVEVLREAVERQQAELEKLRALYKEHQPKSEIGNIELPTDTAENAPPVRGRRPEDGPSGVLRKK